MRQGLTRWFALGLMLAGGSVAAQDKGQPNPDDKPATRSDIADQYQANIKKSEERIRQVIEKLAEAQRKTHEQLETKVQYRTSGGEGFSRPSIRNVKTLSWGDFFAEQYGFDFVEADPVLRSQLSLPEGEGLVVVTVTKEGLAEQSGIKEKDLIAKINLKSVADVAKAREIIAQADDRSVSFDLYRAGKPIHLTLTKPEGETPKVSYWIGTPVAAVDDTLRSHVPTLPVEAGLIVNDVIADSPAAKAGVQKNDILIRTGEDLLTSNEVLIERIQKSAGKEIKIELLRAGKMLTVNVTPEKRVVDPVTLFVETPNGVFRTQMFSGEPFQMPTSAINAARSDNVAKNSSSVNPEELNINRRRSYLPKSGKSIILTMPSDPASQAIGGANARLEAEMNELTDKIEELRRTIDGMKNQKPAGGNTDQ